MAGGGNKKRSDNFAKIKREMTAKKQRAVKQEKEDISPKEIEETNVTLSSDIIIVPDTINKNLELEIKYVTDIKPNIEEIAKQNDVHGIEAKIELVVFRIAAEDFAFRLTDIKEIIRMPSLIKVPNAPFSVTGLCNLRGELLPVIDSHKLFGMHDLDYNEWSRIIVLDIQGKKVGLIADKVMEVTRIEKSMILDPPGNIKGIYDSIINGIVINEDGNRLIMILEAPKILTIGSLEKGSSKYKVDQVIRLDEKLLVEEQVIIFLVGAEEYAFTISSVQEIIRVPDISKVPNTASYIDGIFVLRNELLVVINLGKLLGKNCIQSEQNRIIIINRENLTFGVVVDKVLQVVKITSDSLKECNQEYLKGFLELENSNRLVMLLEPQNLIAYEELSNVLNLNLEKEKNKKVMLLSRGDLESELEYIVIFKLDQNEYGIRIQYIKEINRVNELIHYPGTPTFIDGLVNLRDEVLPVMNLKKIFNYNLSDYELSDHSAKILVVEFRDKKICMKIDSVTEIIKISKNNLQEAASILNSKEDHYIEVLAKLNGGQRTVSVLNLSTILSF